MFVFCWDGVAATNEALADAIDRSMLREGFLRSASTMPSG